jgi:hypothetical protein
VRTVGLSVVAVSMAVLGESVRRIGGWLSGYRFFDVSSKGGMRLGKANLAYSRGNSREYAQPDPPGAAS